MVASHCEYLKDGRNCLRREERSLLEPCEVLTENDWLQWGLTPWVDGIEECSVGLVHVDGTQVVDGFCESTLLEEPLHFKTTSTRIVVREMMWKIILKFLRIGIGIQRSNHT